MKQADKPKAMSKGDIEAIVKTAITDAVAFVESEIAPSRLKAQKYYDGEVSIGHEEGRSKVVSTKVRDKVRAAKPSIMRVFLSTSRPVEFRPNGQDDVALAEQQTDAIHHEFIRLNGYRVLNDAFHDALLKKQGIAKAYWVEEPCAEIHTYTDLSDDEFTVLVMGDDVTVIEHTETPTESGPIHDCKIQRKKVKGELCIESVPPEEFFVSSDARTMEDAYVVVHKTDMRVGDVVKMGFDLDKLVDLATGSEGDKTEVEQRQGYLGAEDNESTLDDSMKKVTVSEAYMRIDTEGLGVPVLHKLMCIGQNYKLLDFEPWDEVPFSKFEVDPEPHAFYGNSLAELILNDQDTTTSVLRGILDNVALVNNPSTAAIESQIVNMDDLLNNEIGAVVRTKAPGAVTPLTVPFVAGQTLSALSYLDGEIEAKTGVTRASSGLAPDTLQANTRVEAAATIQGAAGQIEVMVRNLADGVADFFGIISRLMVKNFDEEKAALMSGNAVPVDPRTWNTDFDMQINVGLGTGREDEKSAGLNQALQMQTMIYQTYGPNNGLVSMVNIRNTLSDLMAVSGIRNADRYFAPITAEQEQQMLQQQAQAAQGQPQADPNAAFLQAEQIKAQAKVQTDGAKLQLDAQKAAAADDLARDQMAQDLLVEGAKIAGQYGQKVDVERVKAEQGKARIIGGIAQGVPQ